MPGISWPFEAADRGAEPGGDLVEATDGLDRSWPASRCRSPSSRRRVSSARLVCDHAVRDRDAGRRSPRADGLAAGHRPRPGCRATPRESSRPGLAPGPRRPWPFGRPVAAPVELLQPAGRPDRRLPSSSPSPSGELDQPADQACPAFPGVPMPAISLSTPSWSFLMPASGSPEAGRQSWPEAAADLPRGRRSASCRRRKRVAGATGRASGEPSDSLPAPSSSLSSPKDSSSAPSASLAEPGTAVSFRPALSSPEPSRSLIRPASSSAAPSRRRSRLASISTAPSVSLAPVSAPPW